MAAYETENTCPVRTVTSTVVISNRHNIALSVKTAEPVPKDRVFDVLAVIHSLSVQAPVHIGDVLVHDVCGTQIVATKDIL